MYLFRGVGEVFLCQFSIAFHRQGESKQALRLGVGSCLLGESRSLSPRCMLKLVSVSSLTFMRIILLLSSTTGTTGKV